MSGLRKIIYCHGPVYNMLSTILFVSGGVVVLSETLTGTPDPTILITGVGMMGMNFVVPEGRSARNPYPLPSYLVGKVDMATGKATVKLAPNEEAALNAWRHAMGFERPQRDNTRLFADRRTNGMLGISMNGHENPPPEMTKGELLNSLPDLRAHQNMLRSLTPLSDESI